MRWHTYAVSSNQSVLQQYTIAMTDLYDPDVTFTGDQPEFYDFWTFLYERYYVYDSRITVRVVNNGTAPLTFCILPTPSTTLTVSNMDEAIESPLR